MKANIQAEMAQATSVPYARRGVARVDRRRVVGLGWLSCAAGLPANAVPLYFILCLLKIPRGTPIRPMVEVVMIFLGSLGGVIIGLPLGIACVVAGRRWWAAWIIGLLGIGLSLSPWFLSRAVWDWVIARQGFIMEP
jgi:hypothetical protein